MFNDGDDDGDNLARYFSSLPTFMSHNEEGAKTLYYYQLMAYFPGFLAQLNMVYLHPCLADSLIK